MFNIIYYYFLLFNVIYYYFEKQNICLLENRNTTIYTGKWRYCYLYWKTEIFLFTVENGNIVVYTGKKDVFISLLEKHISLFILENGYIAIPTCPLTVQIGDHISISPLSKTSSL